MEGLDETLSMFHWRKMGSHYVCPRETLSVVIKGGDWVLIDLVGKWRIKKKEKLCAVVGLGYKYPK